MKMPESPEAVPSRQARLIGVTEMTLMLWVRSLLAFIRLGLF